VQNPLTLILSEWEREHAGISTFFPSLLIVTRQGPPKKFPKVLVTDCR
jgi:hypothetical protein